MRTAMTLTHRPITLTDQMAMTLTERPLVTLYPEGGRGERQTPEPPAAVGRKRRLPRMALPRMAFMSPKLRESSG